jgi:hypothetical protein
MVRHSEYVCLGCLTSSDSAVTTADDLVAAFSSRLRQWWLNFILCDGWGTLSSWKLNNRCLEVTPVSCLNCAAVSKSQHSGKVDINLFNTTIGT